jgi:hypothetical protein
MTIESVYMHHKQRVETIEEVKISALGVVPNSEKRDPK